MTPALLKTLAVASCAERSTSKAKYEEVLAIFGEAHRVVRRNILIKAEAVTQRWIADGCEGM